MAFSHKMDTTVWHHDFPKLAKESGFYFNTNRSRSHVDWNQISTIDINSIIKERNFAIIDQNIHIVLNYSLDSERDVQVLDPNFVKLFHFAQLVIEYLLYCKKYLDHIVVILKDELRLKLADNCQLKKELLTSQEVVKQMKELSREKHKLIDTKFNDSHGEIHKCPHCPKTFVSSVFVNSHIARRHTPVSELNYTITPVQDHYRVETEKLHNEIKSLKERLNQTERIIHNESSKMINNEKPVKEIAIQERKDLKCSEDNNTKEQQKNKYLEVHAKSISLEECKWKDELLSPNDTTSNMDLKKLISQQEKEIKRLKDQLLEHLTPDIESMQIKLQAQENYWKSKLEHLEFQHRRDIESLAAELKSTQEATQLMNAEYSYKVTDLEQKSMNQSKLLTEQSEQLNSLSRGIKISHKTFLENNTNGHIIKQDISPSITIQHKSISNQNENDSQEDFNKKQHFNNVTLLNDNDKTKQILRNYQYILKESNSPHKSEKKKLDKEPTLIEALNLHHRSNSLQKYNEDRTKVFHVKSIHNNTDQKIESEITNLKSLEDDDNSLKKNKKQSKFKSLKDVPTFKLQSSKAFIVEDKEASKIDSESITSDFSSDSESEKPLIEEHYKNGNISSYPLLKTKAITPNKTLKLEEIQESINKRFNKKLKDLGLDPEWLGVPQGTFIQKLEIISHHQNINAKKIPKYDHIKKKILDELFYRLSVKNGIVRNLQSPKKSSLNKLMTNVKKKTIKAFSHEKNQANKLTNTKQMIPPTKRIDNNTSTQESSSDSEESNKYKDDVRLFINSKSPKKILIENKKWSFPPGDNFLTEKTNALLNVTATSTNDRKITSTPNETGQILEYETNLHNSKKNQKVLESTQVLQTPKSNKSVLKSATGSTGSLVKKKVIFDLDNKRNIMYSKSAGELTTELNYKNKESYDSDWNVSSISDEKESILESKKSLSSDNILLKTAQSDKIREITRKIEEQLSSVKQKPAGAIETIIVGNLNKKSQSHEIEHSQSDSPSISSFKLEASNLKSVISQVRPTLRI